MNEYPALLELSAKRLYPLRGAESFLVGRNDTADICVLDARCSRHHFRLIKLQNGYCVERLNELNPTLLNGQTVTGPAPLKHGDVLSAGQTRFRFLTRTSSGLSDARAAPPATSSNATILGAVDLSGADMPDAEPVLLTGSTIIGREPGRVQLLLPHPSVSRLHASVAIQGTKAVLTDLNSANGTFVNGTRMGPQPVVLKRGDCIDIGPFAMLFTGDSLVPHGRANDVELAARSVRRVVRDARTGEPRILLDDVSLVVRPREFVCLLGPSGSGKSTLLSALSGRTGIDGGEVLLNNRDLFANFEAVKQDIAVVPQKEALHESLTVGQALWYTAKLRLPPDTTGPEIESTIAELLETVGMTERRADVIRRLSGGQLKRASLANEILSKPSLLFLDEVTSGLDEQTDREVMNLFRSLADTGKTVVCVTHSLANVERTCHLVVVLTPGGKLAFVGKPKEALEHFEIERLGDVYDRLKARSAEEWKDAFRRCPLWKQYVADRLPPDTESAARIVADVGPSLRSRLMQAVRQTALLLRRYASVWMGDYPSLLAMLGQVLVVGLLLAMLFGDLDELKIPADRARRTVNLLFLLAVSSYWFGCNNAAKEIVKERIIFVRERDRNLRVVSYYLSKWLLLVLFSCAQAALLMGVVQLLCHPPGDGGLELLLLVVLASAGVSLGLLISTISTSEEMAITLIPMAVIPQIILSGAISPLEGASKTLAMAAVSTYWGKRGLDSCLPEEVAAHLRGLQDLESDSFRTAIAVLAIHAFACVAISVAALVFQGRRRTQSARQPTRLLSWFRRR
jgi:ABC transport system ATP-binding/permease protein